MKLYTIVLFTLVAITPAACAGENDDWIATKKQASSAIDAGNCSKAWELVWPWAKRGNVEARAILATGMFAAGLTLPGGRDDGITRYRDSVILAVHGTANGDTAATEMCLALIQGEPVSNMGGEQFARCLNAGTAPQTCVDNAVNAGFVPRFADYSQEIDALASLPRAAKARCQLPGKVENSERPVPK